MRILEENGSTGQITVRVENADDLWELTHILAQGDIISGRTERKIQLGDDRSKQIRKTMNLSIEVENVELQQGTLRIAGTITEGPDDLISYGDHHSFTLQEHQDITISKEWDSLSRQRLDRSTKDDSLQALLVLFDREKADIAELTKRGYAIIRSLSGDVAKKQPGGGSENFFKSIADAVKEIYERGTYSSIIAASPAFWNDYLLNAMSDDIRKVTTTASCSHTGEAGIKEVLKRPELTEVLKADQTSSETKHMQDLLEAISKDKACYGQEECQEKVELGQVSKLLVALALIGKAKEEEWYEKLDALMQQAESMQAEVHIIEHATNQLDALGGIAGVLRW